MFSCTAQPSKSLYPKNSKGLYTNNTSWLYTLAMYINFAGTPFFKICISLFLTMGWYYITSTEHKSNLRDNETEVHKC